MFELAQRGGVGLAEDQSDHVDALVVQLAPERLGENHVECLRGPVGDHVGPADETRARAEDDDSAAAPLDHRRREVVTQLHRYQTVAVHHRLGGVDRVRQERREVRVGACAVHQKADRQVRGGFRDGGGRSQ